MAGGSHYPMINPQLQQQFGNLVVDETLYVIDMLPNDATLEDAVRAIRGHFGDWHPRNIIKMINERFIEMWDQAAAIISAEEEDKAEGTIRFMQLYGELIVKECLYIVNTNPADAAKVIAEKYGIKEWTT